MLAVRLDKEIPCDYICHSIQKLIESYMKDSPNLADAVLVVDIKTIIDDDKNKYLPYKPENES
jgi:GTP-binding protein EngB required for normal cell division